MTPVTYFIALGLSNTLKALALTLFCNEILWTRIPAYADSPNLVFYLAIVTACASSILITLHVLRPQAGSVPLTRRQKIRIGFNGILKAFSILFYGLTLYYIGPVRALLLLETAEVLVVYLMGQLGGKRYQQKSPAVALVTVSVLMVLAEDGITDLLYPIISLFSSSSSSSSSIPTAASTVSSSSFSLMNNGSLNSHIIGVICAIISTFFTMYWRQFSRKLSYDVQSTKFSKRLHALELFASCLVFSLLALFRYMLFGPVISEKVVPVTGTPVTSSQIFYVLLFMTIFYLVIPFYVETFTPSKLSKRIHNLVGVATIFTAAYVCDMVLYNEQLSYVVCLAFVVAVFGVWGSIGVYGTSAVLPSSSSSTGDVVDDEFTSDSSSQGFANLMLYVRVIKADKKSRSIFTFLSVNLIYMFVELLYGYWTNSLGLISDAGHMFFDCFALAIGLYASVVPRVAKPNQTYTYGWGRMETVGGFINAIFLVVVSILVVTESIARIWDPPVINTDRLLVVSILGLVVNLLGVFVFHEAHDAAHGHSHSHGDDDHSHGHSHSHDHGHGHSHGHGHKHKHSQKHSQDEHDHDHDHEHKHKHEHDHDPQHKHSHDQDHQHDHLEQEPSVTVQVELMSNGFHPVEEHQHHHHSHDHNMEGVFVHVLADTLGSVGVIFSSLLVQFFGFNRADPISSLVIGILIFYSVIPLLKKSSTILLQATPVDMQEDVHLAIHQIQRLPGVVRLKEWHVWYHGLEKIIGTVCVRVDPSTNEQKLIQAISDILHNVDVTDVTVQVEKDDAISFETVCAIRPSQVLQV